MSDPKVDHSQKGNILVVDDTPANLRLLSNMLAEQGYKVRSVISGTMALRAAQAAPPDLILLDINMPGMNGYEVCGHLKADELTRDVPIIFISALDETRDKVKAFTVGGVDYITKPFQFEEVLARVETHLSLCRLQHELEQEIVARDKLIAELDAYAHTVAHDLKNPLAALVGFSSLLEKKYERMSQEDICRNLGLIARNSRKMANIIDELLLLAGVRQMDNVELSRLDMQAIVLEAQNRLGDMIVQSSAEIVYPEQWPVVTGYAPWVEEIWANYLSNAVKYGGTPPLVSVGATSLPDGYVRFWVRDNGSGLSEEDLSKLFVPFERLGQAHALGHGLGLSIVQRIAERLGGVVGVKKAPTQGCEFFFTLPLSENEE